MKQDGGKRDDGDGGGQNGDAGRRYGEIGVRTRMIVAFPFIDSERKLFVMLDGGIFHLSRSFTNDFSLLCLRFHQRLFSLDR